MTEHVLSAFTKRRAELAGEAAQLRARLASIAADTGHLDAVIRQFDPDYDLASIRPKRPRGPDVAGRGEMARFVLGVLREATEPVPTGTIAARLMAERGMDGQDRKRAGHGQAGGDGTAASGAAGNRAGGAGGGAGGAVGGGAMNLGNVYELNTWV